MVASIEVDVRGRWDALKLSRCLACYRSYLIEYDEGRWLVRAETPGYHGEQLAQALAEIRRWIDTRHPEGAAVWVDGRPYPHSPHGEPRV